MTMYTSWEEGRTQGRIQGRTEGRTEGRANSVLIVLRARGIVVPEAARKRILAQKDLQRLQRWLEKATTATSIGEVLDDRAEARSSKTARPVAHKERSGRKPARATVQR